MIERATRKRENGKGGLGVKGMHPGISSKQTERHEGHDDEVSAEVVMDFSWGT